VISTIDPTIVRARIVSSRAGMISRKCGPCNHVRAERLINGSFLLQTTKQPPITPY
jgi:hypothetical protein